MIEIQQSKYFKNRFVHIADSLGYTAETSTTL